MGDVKPYSTARWIADEIQNQNFVPLRTMIESVLRTKLTSKSEEEIAEIAESLESNVYKELQIVLEQLERDGVEPTFILEGDELGSYIKANNKEVLEVLARIRSILPKEFEQLCAAILDALGASAREVGGTGDGGVDFLATDMPISKINSVALKVGFPIVIGQAKRYSENNLITVNDLRNFLGGAVVKANEIKTRDERFGIYAPVIFAFWTTSDFNTNAREFAKQSGIWCLGGLAIAQLSIKLKLV